MYKLETVIEVDEDALVAHLLIEAQSHLYGPDFRVLDVVVFTADVRASPYASPFDEGEPHEADQESVPFLPAGWVGVVNRIVRIDPQDPAAPVAYAVLVVDDGGEIGEVVVLAGKLALRDAPARQAAVQ